MEDPVWYSRRLKVRAEDEENCVIRHLPLYKAVLADDWKTARRIFQNDANAVIAKITYWQETPLHIAVGTNRSHRVVEQLVDWIVRTDRENLRITEFTGYNPLHYAAKTGNTKAVKLLVEKDSRMTQIRSPSGKTPLALAARYGRKEAVTYLLKVTKDVVNEEDGTSPFKGVTGAELIISLITADLYDVVLDLLEKYPDLTIEKDKEGCTALQKLASKPKAFPSGYRGWFWENIIYSSLSLPSGLFLNILQYTFPCIKRIHDTKVMHTQTRQIVKIACRSVIYRRNDNATWEILGKAMSKAAIYGIHELIEDCVECYPGVIWYRMDNWLYVFLIAIQNRQEKVYNLVHQMSALKVFAAGQVHKKENALHMAGKLAPSHRLNTVTGAALQMQRELQWFKEVENFVEPSYKEALNKRGKTPRMVFTDEHSTLRKEGEQWMKRYIIVIHSCSCPHCYCGICCCFHHP